MASQQEPVVNSPRVVHVQWRSISIVCGAAVVLIASIIAWRLGAFRDEGLFNRNSAADLTARTLQDEQFAFEVVSIRPSNRDLFPPNIDEDDPCSGYRLQLTGRRLVGTTSTLYDLIAEAYNPWRHTSACSYARTSGLISDGPAWIKSERFAIQALIPEGAADYSSQQFWRGEAPKLQRMLQTMLAQRFNLRMRQETKEMPVYLLTVDQTASRAESRFAASLSQRSGGIPVRWGEGIFSSYPFDPNGNRYTSIAFRKQPMIRLAQRLTTAVQRPILDRTGLAGEFDFILEYDDSGVVRPTLFTALQEQLGLKLQPSKAPVEVLVIERADRLSEN